MIITIDTTKIWRYAAAVLAGFVLGWVTDYVYHHVAIVEKPSRVCPAVCPCDEKPEPERKPPAKQPKPNGDLGQSCIN